jgi:hypothetical protein
VGLASASTAPSQQVRDTAQHNSAQNVGALGAAACKHRLMGMEQQWQAQESGPLDKFSFIPWDSTTLHIYIVHSTLQCSSVQRARDSVEASQPALLWQLARRIS